MQPYSAAHVRQNFTSQLSQPPDVALTTGSHRLSDKPTSDIKGKRREADSASSRTQLETVSEDFGTNEELRLRPSSLTRSPHSGSLTPSANVPLFSGATNSTADIYRRPEPLPQYSYPYNYHYSTPSASPSKSTLIPPKITLDSPSSNSTVPDQPHHKTAGSPSKPPGSAVINSTTSRSHPLPQASPRRARDYANHPGTSQNPPIRRRNHGIAPLTSDARTEHILLAARRIGRERAGLVAGIKQYADHEKAKHARELEDIKVRQDHERSEKERLERLANGTSGLAYYRSTDIPKSPQQRNTGRSSGPAGAPRTPKRGGAGATHYPAMSGALGNSPNSSPTRVPASTGPSTFVFVNSSPVTGTSGNTPDHKRRGSARGSKNLPNNPPTPLDSLLNAARSMMDDGAGEKAGGKINGTRKASEHPESPVPKRRRVSGGGTKTLGRGGGLTGTGTVTRIRSALDVLADQAAAAFDDDPSQTRRESNTKEKIGDEGLSGGGDGEEDNVQEDDLDDSGLLGSASTSASASALSMGLSRGRSRVKTTSTNTRAAAEPKSTSSMSLRPVRQPSQKRLASQDLQPSPSIPMTAAARIKGKTRGRPKGSKSLHRSTVSVKTSSTVALAPLKSRRGEEERSEEHSQWTTIDLNRSSSARLGLRPVVDWGERDAEEDEGDEDEGEAEGEYTSLVATERRELGLDQQNGQENPDTDVAGNDTVNTTRAESGSFFRDMDTETQITLSNVPTSDVSPTDVDLVTIPPVEDVRTAEADLDDEDAEGEQEEEEEDENAEAGQDPSSRSRTPPPPPDPPQSGDSNNNDPDADADAEGEMEYEANEGLLPTSTCSAVHQTALSVPIGQVPLCNFDGGVWLIIFWIKSEKSFGYNTTLAHVLISVRGSLSSSLSILSGLSEKMTLRLVYPEQERKSVERWWRNIDVKLVCRLDDRQGMDELIN